MNRKKLIISSILVLVLCISLIAGSTFALFTSESKTNIAVTSGNVEVVATIENLQTFSIEPNQTNDGYDTIKQPDGTFLNGGTAIVSGGMLTFDKMTPGDKATFDIVFTNNSDVNIKYQTIIRSINDKGLFAGLVVMIEGSEFNGITATSEWIALEKGVQPTDNTISVSVELPQTASNIYQGTSTEISVAVNAVQGNTITTNPNAEVDMVEIYTADDLVAFANAVNKGNDFRGKTVKLMDNIDMSSKTYSTAGIGGAYFAGTFDGNGKTVSNLSVVSVEKAGLIGELRGVVKNLTVDNADIFGNHWAGVIAAYATDNCGANIINCTVKNSAVTLEAELLANGKYDNGDKAGGIMGYIANGNPGIANCLVENVTIKAYRDLGGIVGFADASITDNKVKQLTLTIDDNHNYKEYATDAEHDANPIIGEKGASAVDERNVNYDALTAINNVNEFNSITTNDSVVLTTDLTMDAGTQMKVQESSTINLDNHDLIRSSNAGNAIVINAPDAEVVFEDGRFMSESGGNVVRIEKVKKLIFNDIDFVCNAAGSTGNKLIQTYMTDGDTVEIEFNNCTFDKGYIELGNQSVTFNMSFNNCSFNWEDINGSSFVKMSNRNKGTLSFDDCSFNYTNWWSGNLIQVDQRQDTPITVNLNNITVTGLSGTNNKKPYVVGWNWNSYTQYITINCTGTNIYNYDGIAVDWDTIDTAF